MEHLVVMDHVIRDFSHVVAVNDLSLTIRQGEILGLFGPSGSGKTTTIRLSLGVHLPTKGTVRIFGMPSHRLTAAQRSQIGYAPQEFLFPPTFSAEETVFYAAGLYGKGWFRGRRAIRSVLEQVELWPKRRDRVGTMSGGERRRVTNAAALVHQPRLVFLDEPTSGLDPLLRSRTWDWFRALRDDGRTLLITGHYLAEAESCDRVALMVDGQLVALGTPAELRRQAFGGEIVEVVVSGPLSPAIDLLHGESVVATVQVRGPDRLWLIVEDAGRTVPIIVSHLGERGIELSSVNEVRPPFDEIYEQLVGRHV